MQICIVGEAGFIGSHLVHRLQKKSDSQIVVYDNFSSGRMWHLNGVTSPHWLKIVREDVKDLATLRQCFFG